MSITRESVTYPRARPIFIQALLLTQRSGFFAETHIGFVQCRRLGRCRFVGRLHPRHSRFGLLERGVAAGRDRGRRGDSSGSRLRSVASLYGMPESRSEDPAPGPRWPRRRPRAGFGSCPIRRGPISRGAPYGRRQLPRIQPAACGRPHGRLSSRRRRRRSPARCASGG